MKWRCQHIRHMRGVLDACRADTRFRWTVETGWSLEVFLSVAGASEVRCLHECIARGQIELMGLYDQPFTQLCNLEELCATCELTNRLAEGMPAKPDTVMLNDIGGVSYNFPQILNYYDIKNCIIASNSWRLMFAFTNLPRLFRLTGPDGSKVLLYQIGDDARNIKQDVGPGQYGFGVLYFLWPMLKEIDNTEPQAGDTGELPWLNYRGREGIDTLVSRLEYEKYPYDTLLVQVATDNAGHSTGFLRLSTNGIGAMLSLRLSWGPQHSSLSTLSNVTARAFHPFRVKSPVHGQSTLSRMPPVQVVTAKREGD